VDQKKKLGFKDFAILVGVVGVIILITGGLITWSWWRNVLSADQGYRYAESHSIGGQAEGQAVEVTDLTGVPPPTEAETPRRGDEEVYVS